MNTVCIKGRMIKDAELRYTPAGSSVCDITIAVKNTQDKDSSFFFDCTCWGKTAEFVDKYFGKGKEILITGELRQDKWQDRESGANRSKVKINVREVDFCGFSDGAGCGNQGNQQNNEYQQPADDIGGDDCPF